MCLSTMSLRAPFAGARPRSGRMSRRRPLWWPVVTSFALAIGVAATAGGTEPSPVGDPVLYWNAIALQATAEDHSGTFGPAAQGGPTRTARALAIVHAAVYDAVNSIDRSHAPYRTLVPVGGHSDASIDAAVAAAAHLTLVALYPAQRAVFNDALQRHRAQIPDGRDKGVGTLVGRIAGRRLLLERRDDGAEDEVPYVPKGLPGKHRADPLNPDQGFLTPGWGKVTPFVLQSGFQFRSPPPPALGSRAYAAAYNKVKHLGGDGVNTPMDRTEEQTEIGIYWAYDGTKKLGPPPRLYNQITRVIAAKMGNTVVENARLFALVNLAQADAGITCWESKYVYDFWRPILGIREADRGTGPSGRGDGNPATQGDQDWTPLGAPASNESGDNFTPPFPAYPSGHATFGAATFRTIALFYDTDEIAFTFTSDELNGVTTDNKGNVRPLAARSFDRLSDATTENAQSRIYLGIHWQFDATAGIAMGNAIAEYIFDSALQPVR